MGYTGTPPRVWGKLKQVTIFSVTCRYTPTRVGKTVPGIVRTIEIQVHPHACGENRMTKWTRGMAKGTPPRVWGKLAGEVSPPVVSRYTPTRVGKTLRCQIFSYYTQFSPPKWQFRVTHPLLCYFLFSTVQIS